MSLEKQDFYCTLSAEQMVTLLNIAPLIFQPQHSCPLLIVNSETFVSALHAKRAQSTLVQIGFVVPKWPVTQYY